MSTWHLRRRRFLELLGLGSAAAAGCGDDSASQSGALSEDTFEYIVVGSGAGGGPLACNLARAGHRVLLLEAGNDQGALQSQQVPAFHARSTEEPTMRWDYFVKHYDDDTQARRDSKFVDAVPPGHEPGVLYPRAGTLGGCTAHNAMITVYPHQQDWDLIADATGDDSWRASNMRRYFEILERCQYLKDKNTSGHGFDGWLPVNMPNVRASLTDLTLQKIVTAAAKAFGIDSLGGGLWGNFAGGFVGMKQLLALLGGDINNDDDDRDEREGLFTVPQATNGKERRGPREYILGTLAEGHPLTLLTDALASRVLFDAAASSGAASSGAASSRALRATGVEVLLGKNLYRASPLSDADPEAGERRTFSASREIVLACGAFNTPQLLKLSGIGPRDELEALGIDVRVELPGVGTNLQDRYEVGIISDLSQDFETLDDCTYGAAGDPCMDDWAEAKGPYVNNGVAVSVVLRSRPELSVPDLFVFGVPGYFGGYEPGYSLESYAHKDKFTWAILKAHTDNNAGAVTLRTTDPRDVPEIRFRYFHEGSSDGNADLAAMVRGVELARDIGAKADDLLWFNKYEELFPGNAVSGTGAVEQFVRDEAWGHHASCTCPIGADDDPMAVLDSRFNVRGTRGLRVVDASVFPKIPGFFIVVPIYMISEKATDVLLEEIGEARA
jgi:choline dehydrogenase